MGVGIAMISMLTMLPALLVICGRRAFWSPFFDTIPHVGAAGTDETHGTWRRIGERVTASPRRVWVTGTALLVVLSLGVTQIDTGLTNANSFRGDVESVEGADILARSFPSGLSALTNVIVPDREKAAAVRSALQDSPLVAQVLPPADGPPGARIDVVLSEDPFSTRAFEAPALRRIAREAAGGSNVLVGGPTAESYDYRESATRDNFVILPLALLVVLADPRVLLRAMLAPILLVASVILSFFAALGTGIFFFEYVFGFAGIDPSLPLLAFVFLVALGIDYNIFLMARVREETLRHGTRVGTLRGLAVTGAVITSAGIVLAGTFSALAVLPLVFLTEIGFIIAFGVLLDTFLVRSVLVPGARLRHRPAHLVAVAPAARGPRRAGGRCRRPGRPGHEHPGLKIDGWPGCLRGRAPLQHTTDASRSGPSRVPLRAAHAGPGLHGAGPAVAAHHQRLGGIARRIPRAGLRRVRRARAAADGGTFICGGSLVSNRFFVTAAHCATAGAARPRSPRARSASSSARSTGRSSTRPPIATRSRATR